MATFIGGALPYESGHEYWEARRLPRTYGPYRVYVPSQLPARMLEAPKVETRSTTIIILLAFTLAVAVLGIGLLRKRAQPLSRLEEVDDDEDVD